MHLPIRALVVGAGQRALIYASYALFHPDELQVVGVAEPNEKRRAYVRDLYGLPPEHCFASAEEAADYPKFADVAINGTMDHQHVPTSIPLLRAGYDLLLEKPFAISESEMWALTRAVQAFDRRVMICHVLRYSMFYSAIRQRILDDKIGDILGMHSAEHVSYRHMAVSYVRGKWARKQQGYASMLMAKCSHDLDLIAWMKSGIRPTTVASFGSNFQFRPERAPEGSGTRCLVDCAIERDCIYSARENYIDHVDHHNVYVWGNVDGSREPTLEEKIAALRGDSPYGRCVWKCDMEVVDHQTVVVDFEDGSTATHHMVGGTAKPSRFIHIIGTKGEIEGTFENDRFVVRQIDPRPGHEFLEDIVDVSENSAGAAVAKNHGGGDFRLVRDFVRVMHGEAPSISTTALADSVAGHLIGFSADRAMEEQRVVKLTSNE